MQAEEYKRYPVVALRGVSAFPGNMIHFDVERKITIEAIEKAMEEEKTVFAVAQRDVSIAMPKKEDLYEVGVTAKVKQMVKMTGGVLRVTLEGISRARLLALYEEGDMLTAETEEINKEIQEELTSQDIAKLRGLKDIFRLYAYTNGKLGTNVLAEILEVDSVETLIDQIACLVPIDF